MNKPPTQPGSHKAASPEANGASKVPVLLRRTLASAVAVVPLLLNPPANAADGTWINATSGGLWSDSANWSGGTIADGSGATAFFDTLDLTTANTIMLDAPQTLGALVFGDTASSYYPWTLGNNGNAANVLTLDGPSPTLTLARGNVTNNVVIAGTSGLVVTNVASASYLILNAANTFTGDVYVNDAASGHLYLVLNDAGALGGSPGSPNSVVLAASASARSQLFLNVSGATYPSYNQLIMRPTGSTGSSRGELHSKSGNAAWDGDILLDGINATSTSVLCDLYCDATGTLTINGNIVATNGYAGFFDLRGGGSSTRGVINGTINIGSATMGKNDDCVWTINSTGNSWGTMSHQRGTIALGVNDALPATVPIAMGASGTTILDLNGFSQTLSASVTSGGGNTKRITSTSASVLTFSNATDVSCAASIQGNVSLIKEGPAILTLTAANTHVGDTVINEGTLALSGSGSIAGSSNILIGAGTTIDATAVPLNLTSGQTLKPADLTATLVGTVNVGSGALELVYTNGTPALTVSAGNLVFSGSSAAIIDVPGSISAGLYEVATTVNGGQISGTMPSTVIVNGASGMAGVLTVSNSNLYLSLDSKPSITGQLPALENNSFTFFAGASPAFSVSAVGTELSYQWFTNGVLNTGATSSDMVWTNPPLGALTTYCIVTNTSGSATSMVWSASVIAAPTEAYPAAVLGDGPMGYWRLNEPDNGLGNLNAGVIAHDYLGGNNGVYTNADLGQPGYNPDTDPATTSARFGYSTFDNGVAHGIERVNFATANGSSNAFSIETWVNGYTPISDSGIVTKGYGGGGEQFNLDTGGPGHGFRFFVRDAGGAAKAASSSIVPSYGTWHHVVGVCDQPNGKVVLYVDGKLAASGTVGTNSGILSSTIPVSIGSRHSSATAWANNNYDVQFSGNINDVAIYGYALSSNQVLAHFEAAGIPPAITLQPVAMTNVNYGGTLVVPAAATGSQPLQYRWYDMSAGSYIPGQTNATLVISNFQTVNSYYLTVDNPFGSVDSDVIFVDVITGLNATLAPNTDLTLYAGQTAAYSVTASGNEPIHYQWSTNGVSIAGATNASFAPAVPLGSVAVGCTVTNSYNGFSSITLGPVNLTGVASPTNAYEVAVLSDQPMAYWPLSEPDNGLNNGNMGVTAHEYVSGHDGTYANANLGMSGFDPLNLPELTSSLLGIFEPTNSVITEVDSSVSGIANIDFAQPAGGNAAFSVETWVNLTNSVQNASIVAKGCGHNEQFALDVYTGGFRFVFRDASGTARDTGVSADAANGQWYHVVGVWDGPNGTVRLYVNGTNVASKTGYATGLGLFTPQVNPYLPGANLVNIGSRPSTTSATGYDVQFQGKIANVAIYDSVLSTEQVAAHFEAGSPTPVVPGALNITNLGGGEAQLTWDFTGTLQGATNVAGPYEDIIGATSPHTVTTTNSQMFYRIKQQ